MFTQLPNIPNIAPQFFRVKFPTRRHNTQIRVNAAKLRLYKLGSDGLPGKKIRITVSQLKLVNPGSITGPRDASRPVMLDSKMVDTTQAGWISLDVTGAVERWHRATHRPMALMLQVEDTKQRSLEPNSYLQPLTCEPGKVPARPQSSVGQFVASDPTRGQDSLGLTSQPAPLINGENLLASLNKNNQPLIDISTVEVT